MPRGKKLELTEAQKKQQVAAKREAFVRLAELRTSKAIVAIRNIGSLANKRAYEFTEADVKAIEDAISDTAQAVITSFHDALSGKKSSGGGTFSLTK